MYTQSTAPAVCGIWSQHRTSVLWLDDKEK